MGILGAVCPLEEVRFLISLEPRKARPTTSVVPAAKYSDFIAPYKKHLLPLLLCNESMSNQSNNLVMNKPNQQLIYLVGPVLFVGKFCFTNFNLFQPTSTYFKPFQPILIKNSIFSNFNPLLPISTNLYQSPSKIIPILLHFKQLQPISTNFNPLEPISTNFYPSTLQKNTNFYHLQPSCTNVNLLSLFINLYLLMKRTCP